ncbi:MAG: hypothetical protein HQL32_04350 [Planctomycetes bacterium]|nr:hypothetical protein [Planctomycetota bacterium]
MNTTIPQNREGFPEDWTLVKPIKRKGIIVFIQRNTAMLMASIAIHLLALLVISFLPKTPKKLPPHIKVIYTPTDEQKAPDELMKIVEPQIDFNTIVDVVNDIEDIPDEDPPEIIPVENPPEEPVDDFAQFSDTLFDPSANMDIPFMSYYLGGGAKNGPTGILGNRGDPGLKRKVTPPQTLQAIKHGLSWLAAQQNKNGSWPSKAHPNAVNSAAALAFLGNGNSTKVGQYKYVVERYVNKYCKMQRNDGGVGMHGLATPFVIMAMCDAYAMDPTHKGLESFCKKALQYVLSTQNNNGGWTGSGSSKPKDTNEIDVAQSAWYIMALFSADLSNLEVPREAFKKANQAFQLIAKGAYKGQIVCSSHGGLDESYQSRYAIQSYISTVLQFSGSTQRHPAIAKSSVVINKGMPAPGQQNLWLLYNQGLGMFQLGQNNPNWKYFNQKSLKPLLKTAKRESNGIFWSNPNLYNNTSTKEKTFGSHKYWGDCGNTAMALLNLQVYFRYASIHQYRSGV